MNATRSSGQFLGTARKRIASPRECTEADLRRATSDIYFALFHRVCEAVVEPIGHDAENPAFKETFVTLYRMPDHGLLEKRCNEARSQGFSDGTKRFAQHLVTMKNKRHAADYDPLEKFVISEVQNDLALAEAAMDAFNKIDSAERARFAYFATFEAKKMRANSKP